MAIEDFGKKIGGARKDLWASRGLRLEDISDFNIAERAKYITKNYIWPKPDYEKMLDEGYSRNALYFIKTVRDSIPTAPILRYSDTSEDIELRQDAYITFLTDFKDKLLEVKTDRDIDNIGISYFVDHDYALKTSRYSSYELTNTGSTFINNKLFKAVQMSSTQAEREAGRKEFLSDNINVIRSQYSILTIDDSCSIDKWNSNETRTCIKHERYGGTSYYYSKNAEFNEWLKNIDLQTYRGNYLITHHSTILGITHDYEEAKNFIESKAQEQTNQKAEQKEEQKAANKEAASERKKALVPPILAHINRVGPETHIRDIVGQDFLDTFKIRGGEFGNWLNEAERQTNMNMAYDSFKDLAKALNINDADIAMGGRLNIAFGSRGRKGAAAHYEPLREVINLTKMKGAGSLAHEFFHGMDDVSGKEQGVGSFATESKKLKNVFTELDGIMRYKTVTVTVEEQNKELDERAQQRQDKFINEIKKMVPDRILTAEKIEQRDQLLNELLDKARGPSFEFIKYDFTRTKIKKTLDPIINDLCKFIDTNAQYYKMTSGNKEWLAGQLASINGAYNEERATEPITRRINTQFHDNAKALDGLYSKANHGYWSSTIEMAARAFACYIHDKLQEHGIRNDYLTGHAFQAAMANDGKTVLLYPDKEEREAINQVFDKIVDKMKELGIFHDRVEKELAIQIQNNYIAIQETDAGYSYSITDKDYNLLDGGVIENVGITIQDALKDIKNELTQGEVVESKEACYERVIDGMAQRENEKLQAARMASLGEIGDIKDCKQMTFADWLGNQEEPNSKEMQVATKQHQKEPSQSKKRNRDERER